MPSSNKDRKSDYADLVREHNTNIPNLGSLGIEAIETFVQQNGEYVQVDTILSLTRRLAMTDAVNRQVYYEFELLEQEGVLPAHLAVGNRRFYPTTFLEPVVSTIASGLHARTATKEKSGKIHDIVSKLVGNPELIDAIADLLNEAKAQAR